MPEARVPGTSEVGARYCRRRCQRNFEESSSTCLTVCQAGARLTHVAVEGSVTSSSIPERVFATDRSQASGVVAAEL